VLPVFGKKKEIPENLGGGSAYPATQVREKQKKEAVVFGSSLLYGDGENTHSGERKGEHEEVDP